MNKDVMNHEKGSSPYDAIIEWKINEACNFKCVYCGSSSQSGNAYNRYSDRIAHFFENTDKTFLVCMWGGETFLYPRFVEFCESITKKHYIKIYTNLTSSRINDFAERISPERVGFIDCSLHIDERERCGRVEDFINKFLLLQKKGFNVAATQVAYPPVLARFDELYRFFGSHGITLFPKIFVGWHQGHYPQEYTRGERDKIDFYSRLSKSELQRVTTYYGPHDLCVPLTQGSYSWRGLPCRAGKEVIFLDCDGTFTRCITDHENLGSVTTGELKVHTEPQICNADICQCPSHGLQLAAGRPVILVRMYNMRELSLYRHIKSFVNPMINGLFAGKKVLGRIRKITADEEVT